MSGLRRVGLVLTMAALLSATVVPAASAAPDGSGHGVPLDQLTVVTTPVVDGGHHPGGIRSEATGRDGHGQRDPNTPFIRPP